MIIYPIKLLTQNTTYPIITEEKTALKVTPKTGKRFPYNQSPYKKLKLRASKSPFWNIFRSIIRYRLAFTSGCLMSSSLSRMARGSLVDRFSGNSRPANKKAEKGSVCVKKIGVEKFVFNFVAINRRRRRCKCISDIFIFN